MTYTKQVSNFITNLLISAGQSSILGSSYSLDLTGAVQFAVTMQCSGPAKASGTLTCNIFTSVDNSTYDTTAYAKFNLTMLSAGGDHRFTVPLMPDAKYYKATITNNLTSGYNPDLISVISTVQQ